MSCKHCTGPCDQGRKPCPAPEACELQNDDGREIEFLGAASVVVITLLIILILVLV
jgi:hypothetical protein